MLFFFIDEYQLCSVASWKQWDELKNLQPTAKLNLHMHRDLILEGQFRSTFCENYTEWLNNILEINHSLFGEKTITKFKLQSNGNFKIVDDPVEFMNLYKNEVKKQHNTRLLSTYCDKWTREIYIDDIEKILSGNFKLKDIFL